ncbi:MAG: MerC domain-containing protein [Lysobacteraceae bacterium]
MPPPARRPAPMLDRVGATGSLLCAVHCALLPMVLALLPPLGVAGWLDDDFERGFVLFASGLGLFTLLWGYRRHRAVRALRLLVPGLLALWLGVLYAPLHEAAVPHAIVMTLGGTLVGLAHLANLRLSHGHVHDAHCAH